MNLHLPHLFASRLELGFDESNELGASPCKFQRRFQDLGKRYEAGVASDDIDWFRNLLARQVARVGLLQNDDAGVLPKLPRKLVGADVHRVNLPCAIGEQHIREAAGGASDIERDRASDVKTEIFEPMRKLDPAARNPGMVLPPDLQRRVLGQHVASLGQLLLARENEASHDQRLSLRAALRQPPAHKQLVCADLHVRNRYRIARRQAHAKPNDKTIVITAPI